MERFKSQHQLYILSFAVKSYIDQLYITMVNWNIKFRITVDLRVAMDPKFIANFFVATDSRVNLYLECCMESESPMKVSVRWLYARIICEIIEMNEFDYTLPMSLKPGNSTAVSRRKGYKQQYGRRF